MSYKAFISYSHAADGKLAPALQSALHRFAKPFYRLRAIRVFRDKTSLHLTPELWPLIQAALAKSEYFLLLASPGAARSEWVQMEVGEWLKLRNGSVEHLLIAQTEGEIAWDGAANDFDWTITNALPANLKGAFKREPFYCDLRWARTSADVSLRNPQFLDDVGSLAAALHGKSKDEMMGNDIRAHRVFKAVAAVVGVLLLALAVGATGAAVYANRQTKVAREQRAIAQSQRSIAETQRNAAEWAQKTAEYAAAKELIAAGKERIARHLAEERRLQAERESRIAMSRELAASASNQLPVDPERSVLLALEAHQRAHTAESEDALRRTLLASRVRHTIQYASPVEDAEFSADGRWLLVDRGHSEVLEVGTWKKVAEFRDPGAKVSAAFRRDRKSLLVHYAPLTGSGEHVLRTVENGSWRPTAEWRRTPGEGESIVAGPDGRLVLHRSYSKAVMSLLNEGTVLWTIDKLHSEWAIFSPDGKLLATSVHNENGVEIPRVLEAETGREVHRMNKAIARSKPPVFSDDSRYLAVSDGSSTVTVFDLATGSAVAELSGHHWTIEGLAFDQDGKWLVTAGADGVARVWDAATWTRIAELKGHSTALTSATFSSDGTALVTTSSDGNARVWDTASWAAIAVLNGHTSAVLGAGVSPDGNYVATRSNDSSLRVWEVSGAREIVVVEGALSRWFPPMPFSPDGRLVAVRQSTTQTVDVYDTKTWRRVAALDAGDILGFSPDGRSLFTSGNYGDVHRWDTRNWSQGDGLKRDGTELSEVLGIAFSPDRDRKWILTAGGGDTDARVWDARTGQTAAVLRHHEARVTRAVFSPDGKWIATAGDDSLHIPGVHITETGSWNPVTVLPGHANNVHVVAFSADSRHLLTAGQDQQTRVWETGSWKLIATLPGQDARFSPDARRIVTVGGEISGLWDASTRRLIMRFDGGPMSAAFSADGAFLVTVDKTAAQIRDAATGNPIVAIDLVPPGRTFFTYELTLTGAAFSPDGKWLLFTCNDGITRVLPRERFAPVDELLALAKTRVTRALTGDERVRYLHEAAAREAAGTPRASLRPAGSAGSGGPTAARAAGRTRRPSPSSPR